MNGTEFTEQHAPNCTIKQWQDMIRTWAEIKGWHQPKDEVNVLEKLMLIVTEAAEAAEDVRDGKLETYWDAKGKPCGLPSELADIAIRVLQLCSMLGIDLGQEMGTKMEYNYTRPYRHGGKTA